MPTLNYSKQRQAILDHLQSRKDHPTAEMIYHTLRKSMPNLSAGTVYRNLGLLTELGQVKKLTGLDGVDHYDGDVSAHSHFICQCCGKVDDDFFDADALLNEKAAEHYDGSITSHHVYFYGTCKACLKNKKEK
ncbi:MAG: transcriptional repressor [Lachnospiraceae bacterium]|nr:transcriptional repressor [Lachnospiraceae bacterium]